MIGKGLVSSLLFTLIFTSFTRVLFAQAPNITYLTPQTYASNTPIPPLSPTNTGGAVPATVYGLVSTFAGSGSMGATNATGMSASFYSPNNSAFDAAKNLYVADNSNQLIRKITPSGNVSTFAGTLNTKGANNGPGTSATFFSPGGVAVDAAGNVYVGDQTNNLVRKITPSGVVSTFAGTGAAGLADGPANAATFYSPCGLAFDNSGNLYVSDRSNNQIRKITPAGNVSTFASIGFNEPAGLAFDNAGNLYVADQVNNQIKKITPAGIVTVLAGNVIPNAINGTGTAASFNGPFGVTVDASGNVFVADQLNNLIRMITPAGLVSTIAGNITPGYADGIGTAAIFNSPAGVVVDGLGNIYITEYGGERIRKLVLTGYTIDKALPAGLTFDQTTGIISGTPTGAPTSNTYTITAYNAQGSSVTTVNINIVAGLLSSIIKFPPNSNNNQLDNNGDYDPGATSNNKDTPITYKSSNSAVGIIDATGLVHIVGAGVTIITANQDGDATYSPAIPATTTLTVTIPEIIRFPALPLKIIGDLNFPAGAISNSNIYPITYTSSNPAVATVINGIIHIAGIGTTNITASQAGDNYNIAPTPITRQLTVDPSVIFNPIANKTTCDAAFDFDPGAISSGNPITYSSDNMAVATIVAGKIHIVGTGTVNITATDGITTVTQLLTVNAIPQPAVTITASAQMPISICAGTAVTFTATATNAGSAPLYQWQLNGVNVGTNSSTYFNISLQNNDVVVCTVTNTSTNCLVLPSVSSTPVGVQVIPIVTPTIDINPSGAVCEGSPVTLTASVTNAGPNPTYQWAVNNVNQGTNNRKFTATLNTGDVVTCTLTSSLNCSAPVTSAPSYPNIYPLPVITFTNVTIVHGASVRLNPVITGTVNSFDWSPGTTLDNTASLNPIATPLETTIYQLHVISASGCDGYGTVTVSVQNPIVAPNTFTPNGDGINDLWNIPALLAYPDCTVNIYNRNGATVYYSRGYAISWDGTYNGKPLPVGTYYYVIDPKDGKSKKVSGSITIIR